jgi:hypothetical protein
VWLGSPFLSEEVVRVLACQAQAGTSMGLRRLTALTECNVAAGVLSARGAAGLVCAGLGERCIRNLHAKVSYWMLLAVQPRNQRHRPVGPSSLGSSRRGLPVMPSRFVLSGFNRCHGVCLNTTSASSARPRVGAARPRGDRRGGRCCRPRGHLAAAAQARVCSLSGAIRWGGARRCGRASGTATSVLRR